jgi:transporter family-2 protein
MPTPVLIGLAAIGGVFVTLQAHFMGLMDSRMGTLESVFITYFSGGLVVGLIMLVQRGGNLAAWQQAPWYALSSGILGLFVVGVIGFCAPRLGLVPAFTVLISAQFCAAALLDHFGWLGAPLRPLDISRLVGILTVMFGIWLTLKK